ncbi:hypothetical protein [Bradyrhizobium liaoningense]
MLKNCPSATLVVITGCSTAALPAPIAGAPYGETAFDGIAQRLISPGSLSQVSAVIAMHFDLESTAAVLFSKWFYTTLLTKPNCTIDEAVTHARSQIGATNSIGSPSWANPVLYWRCKDGRPFDVRSYQEEALSSEVERKVLALKIQVDSYRENFQNFMLQPPSVHAIAAEFGRSLIEKIDGFLAQISEIMGNAIRLKDGRITDLGEIKFSLTARLRAPARLDKLRAKVSYEEDALAFVTAGKGANAAKAPLTSAADGVLEILLENVSGGNVLPAGEYEIASFVMKVTDVTQSTRVLTIFEMQVEADPDRFYSSVDGYALPNSSRFLRNALADRTSQARGVYS